MWQYLVPAAAVLLGARSSAKAATSAANTAAAASDRASNVQREMFERQVELQEPWRQSGIAAQNQLLTLLGIAPPETPSGGGGGGFGGVVGAIAGALRQQQGPGLQVDRTSPEFGKYAKEFGMQQFQADPGYAFRLAEGQKALERSAAARGGLLSGGTGKALQRYGQEMGSQEYTNAFNRYQAERAARLAPLQSLAGVGQTTATQLGEAGRSYGTNIGNIGMQQAETAGQAGLARASAYGNALNQLAYLGGRYLGTPSGSPSNRDIERQYLGMD